MSYESIKLKNKVSRCLLCSNPTCNKALGKNLEIAKIIRAIRFDNLSGAKKMLLKKLDEYKEVSDECMNLCRRSKYDEPVDIEGIISILEKMEIPVTESKADLSIDFCGVHCENPFFLSSSVVGSNYSMVARAFDMGWAGVAFKTIGFFVPNELSPRFGTLEKEDNPFVGFKNLEQISDHSLEENLEFFRELKKNYPNKVLIASIMGSNEEEWTELARLCEEAGADIIECNFSCPQMVGEGLGSEVGINNELVKCYTEATKRGTSLPVLAKMTPNITKMEEPAKAAVEGGADGLAAINTIKSLMNVDVDNYSTAPSVLGKSSVGGYSGKAVKPIALRFIHDMKKDETLSNIPISGMGGIETWKDAFEFIALGCETIQVTTAVMQYGYRIIDDMIDGLSDYMVTHGIDKVSDMVGKALTNVIAADDLNRNTIEYPKFDKAKCIGCGRCHISCMDGGHQAIKQDEETDKPILIPDKCVGCQLCVLACPVGAIGRGSRVDKKKCN